MKTEFKAKYLQHLVKKNKDKGFTLIELLVVIIIVGVLAAIALPSFLNQIGKARGSEGKSNLGTINRAQQAYRLEQNTFATRVANLDAKITGKFYSYEVSGTPTTSFVATTTQTTQAGLKAYSAGAVQNGDTFLQLICESSDTVANTATSTAVAAAAAPVCPTNYVSIQ
jgi:prepilin-type N-terminal cleavage/methylation domain-containing protein